MLKQLRPALVIFAMLTVCVGVAYPLLVTGIAQTVFPDNANGSLVIVDGKAVGSRLVGQSFSDPRYFWGRPSATTPVPYDGSASSGSNLGPTNPALSKAVAERIAALLQADPTATRPVPVDLVTTSGSGLDPHISVAAALFQVPRIAHTRALREVRVKKLVLDRQEGRILRILSEPRINVLELNLALDGLK